MNDPEVTAMDDAHSALEDLEYEAKCRVLRYLISRFGISQVDLSDRR